MNPTRFLLIALLLGGCVASPASRQAPAAGGPVAAAAKAGTATVRGTIRLTAPGFGLKALVTPNDAAALAAGRIEVWLDKGEGLTLAGELPGTATDLTLTNLRLDTSYTVTLRAFKDDPNAVGADTAYQMSEDASSTTTFDTLPDEDGAYATEIAKTFALKLADQTFSGSAGNSIQVDPGEVTSTEDAEVLDMPDATIPG